MDADTELATLTSLLDLEEFEVVEVAWDRREKRRRFTLVPKVTVGLCPYQLRDIRLLLPPAQVAFHDA